TFLAESRTKPLSHFSQFRIRGQYFPAGRSSPSSARPVVVFPRYDRARIQFTRKGNCMSKRLIWVDGDDFTGWCCSHCTWGLSAPYLDSSAATLAFNRLAHETFEKHGCGETAHREAKP